MVVSGLPERNGDKHVTEMAYVALDLIQAVTNFRMPHDPEGCLRIRIGIKVFTLDIISFTFDKYAFFISDAAFTSLE
jgi:atrial natriuretic peptide receptor A/atrial natriuretic peptide receptor B